MTRSRLLFYTFCLLAGILAGILLHQHAPGVGAQRESLLIYSWYSPLPVEISSIRVSSGKILQVQGSDDGTTGSIWVVVEKICSSLRVEGVTSTGAGVVMGQNWDVECERIYLPYLGGNDELGR